MAKGLVPVESGRRERAEQKNKTLTAYWPLGGCFEKQSTYGDAHMPNTKSAKSSAPNGAKHSTTPATQPVGAYKLKPAAHYLSVSKPTVYRLVARGLLRPNRATRHLIFPRSNSTGSS
jgi:excisionase family DNA binding protein